MQRAERPTTIRLSSKTAAVGRAGGDRLSRHTAREAVLRASTWTQNTAIAKPPKLDLPLLLSPAWSNIVAVNHVRRRGNGAAAGFARVFRLLLPVLPERPSLDCTRSTRQRRKLRSCPGPGPDRIHVRDPGRYTQATGGEAQQVTQSL